MGGWTAHIRSYGLETPRERHDFVQFVLPLHGAIELDIGGHGGWVGDNVAAVVPDQMPHTQQAHSRQQALILNVDTSLAKDCGLDEIHERRYFEQSQTSQQMTRLLARAVAYSNETAFNFPYLVSHCSVGLKSPSETFNAFVELMQINPFSVMSVKEMALAGGLRESQFHDAFRARFGKPPHKWLVQEKLNAVKRELETTDIALSDLALLAGYSDQTALTRAFKNHFGMPLSEYRHINRN